MTTYRHNEFGPDEFTIDSAVEGFRFDEVNECVQYWKNGIAIDLMVQDYSSFLNFKNIILGLNPRGFDIAYLDNLERWFAHREIHDLSSTLTFEK